MENLEAYSVYDDGIEICGGRVNTKRLAMAFVRSETFDLDLGYQGKGQFWFGMQDDAVDTNGGHNGITHNGQDNPDTLTAPEVFNVTLLGAGIASIGHRALNLDAQAGANYFNSIFVAYPTGVRLEAEEDSTDSYQVFKKGEVRLTHNLFWDIASGKRPATCLKLKSNNDSPQGRNFVNHYEEGQNRHGNPVFNGWNENSRSPGQKALDPRPLVTGAAYENVKEIGVGDSFFENVTFKGAFGEDLWVENWTALDFYGFLGQQGGTPLPDLVFSDTLSYQVDENNIYVSFGITNNGNAATDSILIELIANGIPLLQTEMSGLEAEQTELPVLTIPKNLLSAGEIELTIFLDPDDLITERVETDNDTSLRIINIGFDQIFPTEHLMESGKTSKPTLVFSNPDLIQEVQFFYQHISFDSIRMDIDAQARGDSVWASFYRFPRRAHWNMLLFLITDTDGNSISSARGYTYLRYEGEGLEVPLTRSGKKKKIIK